MAFTSDHCRNPSEISSTERQRLVIRSTPVIGSKYLDVWHRAYSKIKVKRMLANFSAELQLFGTDINDIEDEGMSNEVNALLKNMRRANTEQDLH
jgi:hypothetical protein